MFPTILVGCLQHQPLLVELHLNDSAVCGRVTTKAVPAIFRPKKTGREEASSSVAARLALTVEGSTVTQAINQRRWSFSITGNVQLLEKGFFHDVPLQLTVGTHIHEIHEYWEVNMEPLKTGPLVVHLKTRLFGFLVKFTTNQLTQLFLPVPSKLLLPAALVGGWRFVANLPGAYPSNESNAKGP